MFFKGRKKADGAEEKDRLDPDIEQKQQKEGFSGSVETDEFDHLPPPPKRDEELEEKAAAEKSVSFTYSYNGEDVKEGLFIFQKLTTFKRNIIISVVLLLVFSTYFINIVKNPNQTLSMFLSIMCIAVLCILWIMPRGHVKRVAAIADQNPQSFTMTVYETCVRVGEGERSFLYSFLKEINMVVETKNLFMVCAGKEQIFLLPKRHIGEEIQLQIREVFKAKMQDKFIDKSI